MPSQIQKKLTTGLIGAGLDRDELDLIQHELEMDLEAEQDEDDDAEMDSDNDGLATRSTIRDSLPPTTSQPLTATLPSKPTVPAKRKHITPKKISPEFVDEGDDGAGPGKPNFLSV